MSSGHDLLGCGVDVGRRDLTRSLTGIATHYDVLGVPRNASAEAIRAAYRARARRYHPDRAGHDGAGADADEMAAVNEAYRVLGDPIRRRAYDRSLVSRPARGVPPSDGVHVADDDADPMSDLARAVRPNLTAVPTPARMPWKMMGITAVFGSALVILVAALTEPTEQETPPDGIIVSGSCVAIEANGDAREVACTGDGDLVVDVLVPIDESCPVGTEPHRDHQGRGTVCLVVG